MESGEAGAVASDGGTAVGIGVGVDVGMGVGVLVGKEVGIDVGGAVAVAVGDAVGVDVGEDMGTDGRGQAGTSERAIKATPAMAAIRSILRTNLERCGMSCLPVAGIDVRYQPSARVSTKRVCAAHATRFEELIDVASGPQLRTRVPKLSGLITPQGEG